MDSHRTTATVVGVLYIIGTVAGVLSAVTTQSLLAESDDLKQISRHENQMYLGALFVLVMGLALALIPAVVYPVLKKSNEVLAIGYVRCHWPGFISVYPDGHADDLAGDGYGDLADREGIQPGQSGPGIMIWYRAPVCGTHFARYPQ